MLKSNDIPEYKWGELPPIPDQYGFAGSFSGVVQGSLLVAGGANFPDGGLPWKGSEKIWSDKIFVLEKPSGRWKLVGRMPEPLGYGVSITCTSGLICIGGSNHSGHASHVWLISYLHHKLRITELPPLPFPLANSCGTMIDQKIYLAGGLKAPGDLRPVNVFLSLDLSQSAARQTWDTLETWPGPPRMLSVAGALEGSFFLFSGTDLQDSGGRLQRVYLKDAYCYTPGSGWRLLAEMPEATVAAPGPAVAAGHSQLMIFGGDDGTLATNAEQLAASHPGFSDHILTYNETADSWSLAGKIMTVKKTDAAIHPNESIWAPVTTNLVLWESLLVFPGGEVRPAVRTPRVLTAQQVSTQFKVTK